MKTIWRFIVVVSLLPQLLSIVQEGLAEEAKKARYEAGQED